MKTKFSKSTDSKHKITLESAIVYSSWLASSALGGSEAPFEVKTSFVGEGSKIKIKGKSAKGKSLGKISDVIYGNYYSGKLQIPDNIKQGDMVYFEVELPGLGLKDESGSIAAGPPIKVSNMKWDKAEARRGDVVKMTADLKEVLEGIEVKIKILEYDSDGNHDSIVEIPTVVRNAKIELLWRYEYHEDTDEIPTAEELEKYGRNYNPPEYFFVIDIAGQKFGENQESGLLKFKDYVEIELKNQSGKAVPNEDYVITLPDGTKRQAKLDQYGKAIEKDIPPGACKIEFPSL
jgi:hypothetical protein